VHALCIESCVVVHTVVGFVTYNICHFFKIRFHKASLVRWVNFVCFGGGGGGGRERARERERERERWKDGGCCVAVHTSLNQLKLKINFLKGKKRGLDVGE
jgi:hypothetical protein